MSVFDSAIDLNDIPKSSWKDYIGSGYRNVCYRTDHERNGQIILFGFDKEGNRKTFICPHRSHIHYRVRYKTGLKDIFGQYLATKTFKSSYERHRYLEDMTGMFVAEALKPEQEFLQEMFAEDSFNEDYNLQKQRIFYLDIENEISESFMSPKDALNRINMITLFDTETEKYYTWSLSHAEVEFHDEYDENGKLIWENPLKKIPKDRFDFREFNDNEEKLLRDFLDFWENNYPDVLATYNGRAYDLPYIVRRIENILGEENATRLSPVGRYRKKEPNLDNERENKEAELYVDIDGVSQSDILVLYRDKFNVSPALDGGYGLSNVGEHEELGRKVQYSGSLKDLYLQDYQKFYEYNVRDVDLLYRIDRKRKLTPLGRAMTSSGLCAFDTIYSSISYLSGSLVSFSKVKMGTIFTSYLNKENPSVSYEGAYVFPPIPGLYIDGIMVVDFTSLYPSTIRSMNISPETYVGKISLKPITARTANEIHDFNSEDPIVLSECDAKEFYILQADGKQRKLSRADLDELLDKKCVMTRNNTLFLKHSVKRGAVAEWSSYFFAARKALKKKMKTLDLSIYNHEITDEKEIENVRVTISNLDIMQDSTKKRLNSLYGLFGQKFSPIWNVYIAQSITRNGKFCNQNASRYVASTFIEKYGKDYAIMRDGNPSLTIGGDTDSQFIHIKCITDRMKREEGFPEKLIDWTDEQKLKLWKEMSDFTSNDLNGFVQNLIREYCHTEHPEVLTYALEYIGDIGIYEAKKRYAVRKILSEGPEIVNKIKYSGLELKRSNVSPKIKEFLGEIYENTLTKGWTERDFRAYLNQAYEEFLKLDITDVAFWKGYNTPREACGFMKMAKGSTGIASACTFYNQLIDQLKIGRKYDHIRVGNKIRFSYVNPQNRYGIKYIAFPDGQYPDEFREIFTLDQDTMFDKVILSPLKGYMNATKFRNSDPRKQPLGEIDDI